ncbi:ASCH domain-containing protein [Bradyrhizobium sp. SZCCHNR1070]|uniref:ASCH domain-containing protein n=1 Tax=Bradyrhizobium sp. SZCCHNR1070 TaxID=3057361 RepID=UPI002917127A|nr:ASCH domain-containing protein [Bradyrhizobium sp. SZCCHNR1070]
MKGLIIREPWIGMILDGSKTWELRTQPTTMRGEIALIRKGSGQVVGVADLVDSLPQLDPPGLAESVQFHGVPTLEQAGAIANGWLFPWLIVNARQLSSPVPYLHPSGSVTWVNLDPGVSQAIARAKLASRPEPALASSKALMASAPLRSAKAFLIPDAAEHGTDRGGGTIAKISPALEAELIATADRLGVKVKALGSASTKMRSFIVPTRAGDQIMLLDRIPRSSPRFRIFLAPALDNRIAPHIASIPGAQRFVNANTHDHRARHSAFRAFKEPQPDGEPFGHGWLLEEYLAGELFTRLVKVIRGK